MGGGAGRSKFGARSPAAHPSFFCIPVRTTIPLPTTGGNGISTIPPACNIIPHAVRPYKFHTALLKFFSFLLRIAKFFVYLQRHFLYYALKRR